MIKELDVGHIEEIKELFLSVFTIAPWNDDWSNSEQLHCYIMDLIGNPNSLSLGLYDKGELIGLSLGNIMHWCIGTEYYIYEFCIRTDKQGKGIGTAFLAEVSEYAIKKDVQHIFLQTARTVPAFEFYTKNGFIEIEGHISLCKSLK